MGDADSVVQTIIIMISSYVKMCLLPVLKDCLRLVFPSIAASKERMVSKGRSRRGRVGLEASGSAVDRLAGMR